mmetsp:Transcript_47086/g.84930  ORF Transcript_47086/g.84930 Transcript_47086/m.84930 type:complete len:462 (+) Transcript_47086:173-1558(+)
MLAMDEATAWHGEADHWTWSENSDWARGLPWAPQQMQMQVDRLQAHIDELQQWKYHAEESMRSYVAQQDLLKWQDPSSGQSSPLDFSWPGQALDFKLGSSRSRSKAASKTTASSPASSPAGSPSARSLSSLQPMRLPLGPEPPLAPLSLAVSRHGSFVESSESRDPLLPGLLHPPGLTLARAASRTICSSDDAKEPRLQLPPGLLDDEDDELVSVAEAAAAPAVPRALSSSAPSAEVSPGITVCPVEVQGAICTRAEWRIDDLRGKLQASMGRPLVSPPFSARGLPNLRLMVFPDAREAVKGVRSRERKGLYAAMVKKGPLHGALKLKADCLERAAVLRFYLTVGAVRSGPFTYDFSERAIHGCEDFGADWLKQIDDNSENLRVGLEILDVQEFAALGSKARQLLLEYPNPIGPAVWMNSPAQNVEPAVFKSEGSVPQSAGRSSRGKRGTGSQRNERPRGS